MFLIASHAWARDSCSTAGISTPAGREGTCARYQGLFGGKTIYTVVNAGHVLRMPGYDAQLLATNVHPTQVSNPQSDPGAYPNGEGMLVSLEISVANTSRAPLAFDVAGRDVDLLIDNLNDPDYSISFPDLPNAAGEPEPAIADLGPIAPNDTRAGWVSFVAPIWSQTVLHERAADLEFYRPGREQGYVGQIRLWKAANSAGEAALAVGEPGAIPVASPPAN